MDEPVSLKQMIQGMIPQEVELIQGMVLSVDPLEIRAVNDEKRILRKNSCVIPRHLQEHSETVSIPGIYDGAIIKSGLQPGERVHILSVQHGKKYIVIDRV